MKRALFIISTLLGLSTVNCQTTVKDTLSVSKDSQVWSYDPEGTFDRGTDRRDIVIYEWTKSGKPTSKYGLLDFDFSNIPYSAEVSSATLYLYHDPASVDEDHSQLSGENSASIYRITSDWEESLGWDSTPTYNTEYSSRIAASLSRTQDYMIDVTELTDNIFDNRKNSFGYLIKMNSSNYYRSLVFASSNNPDADLHPKLVIEYTVPEIQCVNLSSEDGKDAQVWSYDAVGDFDRGTDRRDIVIYEWTRNGSATSKYGLINFDFSQVPKNITLDSAILSLSHDQGSVDEGHSQLSGENSASIYRITSDWEESLGWDSTPTNSIENATLIAASESSDQDYSIDVLNLTQDIINDRENSFGYIIKMNSPDHYRSLVFASGEHPNVDLRPSLKVCFSENVLLGTFSVSESESFIFPSPNTIGILYLNNLESGNVSIRDIAGNEVLSSFVEDNAVDISSLAEGIYFLNINGQTLKFVKK